MPRNFLITTLDGRQHFVYTDSDPVDTSPRFLGNVANIEVFEAGVCRSIIPTTL